MIFKKIILKNHILLLILILGLLLRLYRAVEMMGFGHDSDVASWIVKDIVVNRHLRLIGQETSTQGVFIGSLHYYLLVPFYFLFGMSPVGGLGQTVLLGLFGILSFYFVFWKVFDRKTGLMAAFFYAVSFFTVGNDRGIVPTSAIIVWTVWFFYGVNLLLEGKQRKSFVILAILVGLIWHINVTLVLLIPVIFLAWYLSKKRIDLKAVAYGSGTLIFTTLPLLIFELKHSFSQTKAVYQDFTAAGGLNAGGLGKLQEVFDIAFQNITTLIWHPSKAYFFIVPVLLIVAFMFLVRKRVLLRSQAIVMIFWPILFIIFFSFYSRNILEYYINGMMIVWIAVFVLFISYLIEKKTLRIWGTLILVVFTVINLLRLYHLKPNGYGYVERRAAVEFIKKDSEEHNYPCVSVSHMSAPGYDLGYRYLFWLNNMHVNHPRSESPVYTIVYPPSRAGRVDASFGLIGVVLPDYERYNIKDVLESCSGENSNLTDPMFKYTQ